MDTCSSPPMVDTNQNSLGGNKSRRENHLSQYPDTCSIYVTSFSVTLPRTDRLYKLYIKETKVFSQ